MKTEKTFSLQITLEPFVKDVFWRLWNIFIYTTWIYLAFSYTKTLVKLSKGIDIYKVSFDQKGFMGTIDNLMNRFDSTLAWTCETFDYYKDWHYTIVYKHMPGDERWLIFSLSFPWAITDTFNNIPASPVLE